MPARTTPARTVPASGPSAPATPALGPSAPATPAPTPVLPDPGTPAHAEALLAAGLFLAGHYLDTHPDLAEAGVDPLRHYCEHGWREGRVANPYFDAPFYAAQALRGAAPQDPLLHYALLGARLGHRPNPYFDPAWYRATHMRGLPAEREPLLHFLAEGEARDHRPIAWFDTAWYRRANALPGAQSPLLHYLAHRHAGRLSPLPEFDVAFYGRARRDVLAHGLDPFQHYLDHGAAEGEDPSPGFETAFYARRYLRRSPRTNPLLHYLQHRSQPGVFATTREALRHDLGRAARLGRRRVAFPLCWHDGVAVRTEMLHAFLAEPDLPLGFFLLWGNERLAEQPGLDPAQRNALLAYRHDPADDEDICGLAAACFADPRYLRHDGAPVLGLYAHGSDPAIAQVAARWRRLLPGGTVVYVTPSWAMAA